MRIFITGATGYIGKEVAKALRLKGHTVFGLVRSEEKAKVLLQNEINPIFGNLRDPDSYNKGLALAEVFIHAAYEDSKEGPHLDTLTLDHLINFAKNSKSSHTIIYTSGTWCCGSNPFLVDETTITEPVSFTKLRKAKEEKLLNACDEKLRGVVIRPGMVYGKSGSLTDLFFRSAEQGMVEMVGDGSNRWAMIHVDDLADAFVKAVEKRLTKEVINVVNGTRFTVREIAEEVAKAAGIPGKVRSLSDEEAKSRYDFMVEGFTANQLVSNEKARLLLDWIPLHPSFIDGVKLYFDSWKAYQ